MKNRRQFLALSAAVAISLARKQRIGPVWLAAFGYAIACQIPIYLMRSSKFTALELAQTLRYFPDLVFVLALLAAVGFCAPNRAGSGWLDASRARANTQSVKDARGHTAWMTFTVEVGDTTRLAQVLALVGQVRGVRRARRK